VAGLNVTVSYDRTNYRLILKEKYIIYLRVVVVFSNSSNSRVVQTILLSNIDNNIWY